MSDRMALKIAIDLMHVPSQVRLLRSHPHHPGKPGHRLLPRGRRGAQSGSAIGRLHGIRRRRDRRSPAAGPPGAAEVEQVLAHGMALFLTGAAGSRAGAQPPERIQRLGRHPVFGTCDGQRSDAGPGRVEHRCGDGDQALLQFGDRGGVAFFVAEDFGPAGDPAFGE